MMTAGPVREALSEMFSLTRWFHTPMPPWHRGYRSIAGMIRVTNIARIGNTTKISVIQNVLDLRQRFMKSIMASPYNTNPLLRLLKNGKLPTDQSKYRLLQPG